MEWSEDQLDSQQRRSIEAHTRFLDHEDVLRDEQQFKKTREENGTQTQRSITRPSTSLFKIKQRSASETISAPFTSTMPKILASRPQTVHAKESLRVSADKSGVNWGERNPKILLDQVKHATRPASPKRKLSQSLSSFTLPPPSAENSPEPTHRGSPKLPYNSNVLFQNEGTDADSNQPNFFPLEIFDDASFEKLTPQEWLQKYDNKVPGYTRWYSNNGQSDWRKCIAIAFDEKQQKFLIEWDSNKKKKYVSRLNIRFQEEDITLFQNRIQTATNNRLYSEAQLRRRVRMETYDCVRLPTLQSHLPQFLNRINQRNSKASKLQGKLHLQLIEEVESNYQRIAKQLEYDQKFPFVQELDDQLKYKYEEEMNAGQKQWYSMGGTPHNFSDIANDLESHYVRTNPHTWKAMSSIHCLVVDVGEMHLLNVHMERAEGDGDYLDLHGYRDKQSHDIITGMQHLINDVKPNLETIIMSAINNNQEESLERTGQNVKYEKLINVSNRMLRDALRTSAVSSLTSYCDIFIRYLKVVKDINIRKKWRGTAGHQSTISNSNVRPMFKISIVFTDGKLDYSPRLEEFQQIIPGIVRQLIDHLQHTPSLEVSSIRHEMDPKLDVLSPTEPYIVHMIQELIESVDNNAELLRVYRDILSAYEETLVIDKAQYTASFNGKKLSLSSFKSEMEKSIRYQGYIEERLESQLNIGMFAIDCSWLKQTLCEIMSDLRRSCLDNFRTQAYDELNVIFDRFVEISDKLNQVPKTPQELSSLSDFVQKIAVEQFTLQQKIDTVMKKYNILEEFFFEVTTEEFEKLWELYGWPQRIKNKISDVEKINQIERLKMIRELRSNQKSLEDTMQRVSEEVLEIEKYRDMDNALNTGDGVKALYQELLAARELAKLYNLQEKLFDFELSSTAKIIDDFIREFEPICTLWSTATDWILTHSRWLSSTFVSLNADHMSKFLTDSSRVAVRSIKLFKNKKEGPFHVATQMKNRIDEFKIVMSMITKLRHPGIRTRHWEMIAKDVNFKMPTESEFTLNFVLKLHLENHVEEVNKTTDVAINEFTLETALDKMHNDLRNYSFELVPYRDSGTYIVTKVEDLSAIIDDQLVMLSTMLTSPYIITFMQRARQWKDQLHRLQDTIEEWLTCQKRWYYLGPIFASEDINRQLPVEGRKYAAVDTVWCKIMESIHTNPKALAIIVNDKLIRQLTDCNRLLDVILKGLNEYLEVKRSAFPRLYFLSNDDLLNILSQSKDPTCIIPHLRKCFENLVSVKFSQQMNIKVMSSNEGEKVPLTEEVVVIGKELERWLLDLQNTMKLTLRKILSRAVMSYGKMKYDLWVFGWPAQAMLAANQILFTQSVTEILRQGDIQEMRVYRKKIVEELGELTNLVNGQLDPLQRATVGALLVLSVHNRDLLSKMISSHVTDASQFEWTSQLRYYWEENHCTVKMLGAAFDYGYEYLGNTSRLVLTPLTDRSYRTMVSAVHFGMGAAPSGPAGTGKTESVKDLAKAIAKQCVVFNCSSSVDYVSLGKIFKGLASSGAWACLDEFNRIEISVLSVVSQQILSIQQGIAERCATVTVDGSTVSLDLTCALFVTMNPGYKGRTELPENVKALFRPVSMVVPDYNYIAENLLFSEGFQHATILAGKLVNCFRLAVEQLSSQTHYDFGLRTIRTALLMAGMLKRSAPKNENPLRTPTDDVTTWEESIVYRALRDTNVPKLVDEDIPQFMAILTDLFPTVSSLGGSHANLSVSVELAAGDMQLQPTPALITKCLQLYDILSSRHAIMIVGETYSGKTTCWRVLARALSRLKDSMYKKIQATVINPKAVSLNQLYGETTANLEWSDGILSSVVRSLSKEHEAFMAEDGEQVGRDVNHWLVMDGPIDPNWVENLNTVLDDNKILCLPNSERIPFPNFAKFIFEVSDLEHASPATISRVGVVCMDSLLPWRYIVKSWMQKFADEMQPLLRNIERLIGDFVNDTLVFLQKKFPRIITSDVALVKSLLNVIDCFLIHMNTGKSGNNTNPVSEPVTETNMSDKSPSSNSLSTAQPRSSRPHYDPQRMQSQFEEKKMTFPWEPFHTKLMTFAFNGTEEERVGSMEAVLLFSLVWSLGASLDHKERKVFDNFLRQRTRDTNTNYTFPAPLTVYDYYFDFEELRWIPWMENPSMKGYRIDPSIHLQESIVPTPSTASVEFLLQLLLHGKKPMILHGSSGIGKTLELASLLTSGLHPNHVPLTVNLTNSTTSQYLQDTLESHMDRRKGKWVGPSMGKSLVCFVDNIDVPDSDSFGSCPPIELLRQFLDHGGWFDLKEKVFREVTDLVLLMATGPTDDMSRLNARFLRHFNTIYVPDPDDDSVETIISTVLEANAPKMHPGVKPLIECVAKATVKLFHSTSNRIVPTITSPHYLFSIRDVWKIVKGITYAFYQLSSINVTQLTRLWYHESLRVLGDRMSTAEHRSFFLSTLMDLAKGVLDADVTTLSEKMIYAEMTPSTYEEVPSMDKLIATMRHHLHEYNTHTSRPIDIYLFRDAVFQLTKILRVIKHPQGNALLLGAGGSGRSSLARLAAHISELELFEVSLSHSYDLEDWVDDMRKIVRMTGVQGKSVLFLFKDSQIMYESFLEDINNLMHGGHIPNLFQREEIEAMIGAYQSGPAHKSMAKLPPDTIYHRFREDVKRNLRVVICMDTNNSMFRKRLIKFPALITSCSTDWYAPWDSSSLQVVAKHSLNLSALTQKAPASNSVIIEVCVEIHQCMSSFSRQFYDTTKRQAIVTTSSFFEFLSVFQKCLDKKLSEKESLAKRLTTGREKLGEVSLMVSQLQTNLEASVPVLERTSLEMEKLMIVLLEKRKEADATRIMVKEEEAIAIEEAREARTLAEGAELQLAEALPALEAATKALNRISRKDVTEIRSFTTPPPGMVAVIEALCILLGKKSTKNMKKDEGWVEAKAMLNESHFIQRLLDFDKDNIKEEAILKLRPYIQDPQFTPAYVEKASVACKSLCAWVRAIEHYYWVSKAVEPRKKRLEEANSTLKSTLSKLEERRGKLQEVEDKIASLTEQYGAAEEKKNGLMSSVSECQIKLSRAKKLIGGLGGETVRWEQMIHQVEGSWHMLLGDALLSAATIVYCPPYSAHFRQKILGQWQSLLRKSAVSYTDPWCLTGSIGNPIQMRSWNIDGLPYDNHSMENAVMCINSPRWPLLIDPQGQANHWIRCMERDNKLTVSTITSPDYISVLENCVHFGMPLLLEGVEQSLDPMLEALLSRQVFQVEGQSVVRLGDRVIPYNPSFRLYITSRHPNPQFPLELCTKVNIIDFRITVSGLEDQLLHMVVKSEKEELEKQSNQLTETIAHSKKELQETEDRILHLLYNAEGDILEDEVLIDTLATSKRTSIEIWTRLIQSERTQQELRRARERYQPVTTRAASLYFCVADLALVDSMYQFSLHWFTQLFIASIQSTPTRQHDIDQRVITMNEEFPRCLFRNVYNCLFEKHKLLFSFMLCTRIQQSVGQIQREEWNFLLLGTVHPGAASPSLGMEPPEWMSRSMWEMVEHLSMVKGMENVAKSIVEEERTWKAFVDMSDPDLSVLPPPYNDLSHFKKVLVIRCLRFDKLVSYMQQYVLNKFGREFIEAPPLTFSECYERTNCITPIVIILSAGANPVDEIFAFGARADMSKKIQSISLGQEQAPIAEKLIDVAVDRGHWIILQNCHLDVKWLEKLEKIIREISPERADPRFRIWLTSSPTEEFPTSLLQNCVKMVSEHPMGIRAKLQRSFQRIGPEKIDQHIGSNSWTKLLFGICFFHAVVQERKKFGSIGWNRPYEFSDSDLITSIRQLEIHLDLLSTKKDKDTNRNAGQLDALRYMIGECFYGGRVTDDRDRSLLMAILSDYVVEYPKKTDHPYGDGEVYRVPASGSFRTFIEFADQLPMNDRPHIFGMHSNAEIARNISQAKSILGLVTSMPRLTKSIHSMQDEENFAVKRLREIMEMLPQKWDVDEVLKLHPISFTDSLPSVLYQEVLSYNRLIQIIRESCQHALDALSGLTLVTPATEKMMGDIFYKQVPRIWMEHSYLSEQTLDHYLHDLTSRLQFIGGWISDGVPKLFHINKLFYPRKFLTAVQQMYARQKSLPMNTVGFSSTFLTETETANMLKEEGRANRTDSGECYIYGLFLEGARWDFETRSLEEAKPHELFASIPVVRLQPYSTVNEPKSRSSNNSYACPIFITHSREGALNSIGISDNFVSIIDFPSSKPEKHWLTRGSSLCQELPRRRVKVIRERNRKRSLTPKMISLPVAFHLVEDKEISGSFSGKRVDSWRSGVFVSAHTANRTFPLAMRAHFLLFAALLAVFFCTTYVEGTHFRYGIIQWNIPDPSKPSQFNFKIQFVWRRSFMYQNNLGSCEKVNDQISLYNYYMALGDGNGIYVNVQNVTSFDTTLDWCAAFWSGGYTYKDVTTPTTRTIFHTNNARLSSLQNNHDVAWYLQSTLVQYPPGYPVSQMILSSPVSAGLPIVQVRNGLINKYQIPADIRLNDGSWTDSAGNPITFRMSNLTEQLGQPPYSTSDNTVKLCPGVSINSTTGVVTFDATSLSGGSRLYQTQHMLDNGKGGVIPIDYILNATDTVGICSNNNAKTCVKNSDCGNSATCLYSQPLVIDANAVPQTNRLTVAKQPGDTSTPMSWYFVADDAVINNPVAITYSGLPSGATISSQASCNDGNCACTNGKCKNPQYMIFNWPKPLAGTYQICFAVSQYATNPTTNLPSGQYCVGLNIQPICNSGYLNTSNPSCSSSSFSPATCCVCPAGYDSSSRCTSCLNNYYGTSCKPCSNCGNGTCSDGLNGDGTCLCNPGWQGVACDRPIRVYCDPSAKSYIQSQTQGRIVDPLFANLYMSVNSQSQGSASINFTVNMQSNPPVDIIVLQDVSANGDITPLQNIDLCKSFFSNLIATYPSSQAALASVSNYGSTYRRLGILTSSSDTFCNYASGLSLNSTAKLSQIGAYDALTPLMADNYGWQSSSYKVIAVITPNPPAGSFSTAVKALSTLGATIMFYAQSSSTYNTYSSVVSSAGFGTAYQGSTGAANAYYQIIPNGIANSLPQTKATVYNDQGFFSSSTNGNAATTSSKGWSNVNYAYPTGLVKGQVVTLPVSTVAIMGWGTSTVQVVLNRAPVSQSVFFQPTQDVAFSFNLTGSDADNNLMLAKWIALPNNATLTTTNGAAIVAGQYYNFSQVYTNTPFYKGQSVGTFQLWDGCDPSAIYTATFSVIPVNYPSYTSNFAQSLLQGGSINVDFVGSNLIGNPDPSVTPSSLTVYIKTAPAQGQLLDSQGNVLTPGSRVPGSVLTYSAAIVNNNYFFGAYNFSYYCTDNYGQSNVSFGFLNVNFTNHLPTITVPTVTASIGTATPFFITVNDVDSQDTAQLNGTFIWVSSSVTAFTYVDSTGTRSVPNSATSFILANTPSNPSATASFSISLDDYATGTIGSYSLTAVDSHGGVSSVATVNVVAKANQNPTFKSAAQVVTMPQGSSSVSITVVGTDADGLQGAKLLFYVNQNPSNGLLSTQAGSPLPSTLPNGGYVFAISDRTNDSVAKTSSYTFTYTPNDYFYGPDTISYGMRDVLGGYVMQTITVQVPFRDHAPTINGPATVQGPIGVSTNFTFSVLDKDVPDNVTVLLSSYNLQHVSSASIGKQGGALTAFNVNSGVLVLQGSASATYIVVLVLDDTAANTLGSLSFAALDGYGQVSAQNLTVTITAGPNSKPFFVQAPSVVSLTEDGNVNITLTGSDNDGHQGASLTFTFLTLPANGKVYVSNGNNLAGSGNAYNADTFVNSVMPSTSSFTFQYVPTLYTFGNDSVSIYATDPLNGISTTLTIVLAVQFKNHAPTLSAPSSIGCSIGSNCTLPLYLNDVDTVDTLTLIESNTNLVSVSAYYMSIAGATPTAFTATTSGLPRVTQVNVIIQLKPTATGNLGTISFYVRDLSNANSPVATISVAAANNTAPYRQYQDPVNTVTFSQTASQLIKLNGTDADNGQGQQLSLIFSTVPKNGSLSINGVAVTANSPFSPSAATTGPNSTLYAVSYTPTSFKYGTDSFSYSFIDILGGQSVVYTSQLNVTFVNNPPTLSTPSTSVTCNIGAKCLIPYYIADPDLPESETLLFSSFNLSATFVKKMTTVYNNTESAALVATADSAAASNLAPTSTVQLALVIDDNAVGSLGSIALYAQDSHGGKSAVITVQVTAGVDTPPYVIYAPSTVTVQGDGRVFISVNASDVDGNQGANLTFTLVSAPSHGQITAGKSGALIGSSTTLSTTENTPSSYVPQAQTLGTSTYGFFYSPAQYYSGSDSLSFYVSDALGGQTTVQTISIIVTFVNHPPTLSTASSSVICPIGNNCTLLFAGKDYDPQDTLAFVINSFALSEVTGVWTSYNGTITSVTQAIKSGSFPGDYLNSLPNSVQFNLIVGFSSNIIGNLGTANFTARDNHNANSSVVSIALRAATSTPPFLVSPNVTSFVAQGLEEQPLLVNLTGSDVDGTQGDNLTLVIVGVPSSGALSFNGQVQAAGSSLPLLQRVSDDLVTPPTTFYQMSYNPAKLFYGSDSFSFKFVDSVGTSSITYTYAINVTHVNHPPTGSDFVLSVNSGFNTSMVNRFSAADVDGDHLKLNISTVPQKGSIYKADNSVVTVGQLIDSSEWNGLYYLCPIENSGLDGVTFSFTDGQASSSVYNGEIDITLSDRAPVTADVNVTLDMNTVQNLTVNAINLNVGQNNVLTINILTTPIGSLCLEAELVHCLKAGSIYRGEATALFYSPPAGAYNKNGPYEIIHYSATNPASHSSDISSISLTVNYVNAPPVPNIQSPLVVYEASFTQFYLDASDDQTPANQLLFYLKSAPTNGILQLASIEVGELPTNFTAVAHGGNTTYPASLNGESRMMVFFPWEFDYGDNYANFTITVVDGGGLSTDVNVTVNVIHVDQPPTIIPGDASYANYENGNIVISFNGTDIDTPAPLLLGNVAKFPQRGSLFTCNYTASDDSCVPGSQIAYRLNDNDFPPVYTDNTTAVFKFVFVPTPGTSQIVYAVPSFSVMDDYEKSSAVYTPKIRIIAVNQAPVLGYKSEYESLNNATLPVTNVTVEDPDGGSIRILLRINTTLPGRINLTSHAAWIETRNSECNRTDDGVHEVIECLAPQSSLRLYLQSLTFASPVVGNFTVGLYVNDLGAGADSDRRDISHKDASGTFGVQVTTVTEVVPDTGKPLTWAVGVGSAGGALGAAAAVAAVARLVKKPDNEIFANMMDFDSAGVVDNPLYVETSKDVNNPLFDSEI
ncbi:putative dynein heavy chain [Planoprotostelium fungivorum]|uniref:Putative dynein heavy chain n=1 Tax=Planoprotostelium fungivorum TaxID=1890364 RepID=A0A2P6NVE8_9EUKA|nr:putative dynein heavy chain [Planoprotostelium fungivorum]